MYIEEIQTKALLRANGELYWRANGVGYGLRGSAVDYIFPDAMPKELPFDAWLYRVYPDNSHFTHASSLRRYLVIVVPDLEPHTYLLGYWLGAQRGLPRLYGMQPAPLQRAPRDLIISFYAWLEHTYVDLDLDVYTMPLLAWEFLRTVEMTQLDPDTLLVGLATCPELINARRTDGWVHLDTTESA